MEGAGRLDEKTVTYFKRVEQVLSDQSFGDDLDRQTFLDNVMCQMDGIETRLACNQHLSLVLEKMLESTSPVDIIALHLKLLTNWEELVCDKFGSHVIQSCITHIPQLMTSERGEELKRVFCDMCSSLLGDMTRMLNDTYGSHVLRQIIETLAGYKVTATQRPIRDARQRTVKQDSKLNERLIQLEGTRPKKFSKLLRKFGKRVAARDDLPTLPAHPTASPVLQTLLELLVHTEPESGHSLCQAVLLSIGITSPTNPIECDLLVHPIGSHLIEVLLLVTSDGEFQLVYNVCFRGKLSSLASHPIANHPVQSLIQSVRNNAQLEMIADELLPSFEAVLMTGNVGVIVRLVEGLGKKKTRQREALKSLLLAFRVSDVPLECLNSFLALQPLDSISGKTDSLSDEQNLGFVNRSLQVSGSLLVQALFQFEDTQTLTSSLLKLSTSETTFLCCHPSGSRAVEAFLKSRTVKPNKKKKFVAKLGGNLTMLACDKWGSHVIDSCWAKSEMTVKKEMAKELVAHESRLRENFSGKIVWRNCRLDDAKGKACDWQKKVESDDRKRKMFDDIVGESRNEEEDSKQAAVVSTVLGDKYQNELKQLGLGSGELILTESQPEVEQKSDNELSDFHTLTELGEADDIMENIFRQSGGRKQNRSERKRKRDVSVGDMSVKKTSVRVSKEMQFIVDAICATKKTKRDNDSSKKKRKDKRQFSR